MIYNKFDSVTGQCGQREQYKHFLVKFAMYRAGAAA